MGLDIVGRFIPRDGPPVLPIPRWIDASSLEPQLQRLSDHNRSRAMRGCCHIDDRHEFRGKRHTYLTEV